MKRTALLCLALFVGMAATAQDKLRIGVEGAYPPFSQIGPDGKLIGFDIDIALALCARMQRQCTLVQSEFDALIPALRARKFDAVVASLSITADRLKAVDFSDKYYNTPARLITRSDASFDATPQGLKGKRVGVQRTTTHDRYASATFSASEIVRYSKQDEVFLDLVNGRVDAALVDSVAGDQGFLKTPAGRGFGFRGPRFDDPAFFGNGAGIAVRKGDTALRDKLNAAIAAIRADGSYKALNDKYFAFDVYGAELKK